MNSFSKRFLMSRVASGNLLNKCVNNYVASMSDDSLSIKRNCGRRSIYYRLIYGNKYDVKKRHTRVLIGSFRNSCTRVGWLLRKDINKRSLEI